MSSVGVEEKENDKFERHSTDRFIPLRKHSSMEAAPSFTLIEEENAQAVRGQEVKEEKMTLDEMYRCVLLDRNHSKMLSFGAGGK